jgi:hypothetical protein
VGGKGRELALNVLGCLALMMKPSSASLIAAASNRGQGSLPCSLAHEIIGHHVSRIIHVAVPELLELGRILLQVLPCQSLGQDEIA